MFEIIGIICVIALMYAVWQKQELKKFQVTHYEMRSAKVAETVKAAVVSDLHSFSYGEKNGRLLRAIFEEKPDMVLVPGDLIVTAKTQGYTVALHLIQQLCTAGIPVYVSNGNHETRAGLPDFEGQADFLQYNRQLEQAGAVILNNQSCEVTKGGARIRISGLELPLYSYQKGHRPYLEEGYLKRQLGKAKTDGLQILLAHHPAFAPQYAAWGADLTVCGHNHGGLVCIPGIGSVLSPQFMLFPKYDAGEFTIGEKKVYISRGLGTHTFHIRVFNRAELAVIAVKPKQ